MSISVVGLHSPRKLNVSYKKGVALTRIVCMSGVHRLQRPHVPMTASSPFATSGDPSMLQPWGSGGDSAVLPNGGGSEAGNAANLALLNAYGLAPGQGNDGAGSGFRRMQRNPMSGSVAMPGNFSGVGGPHGAAPPPPPRTGSSSYRY